MKKNRKVSIKVKTRLLFSFIFFSVVISILSFKFINNLSNIKKMDSIKKDLIAKITSLKEEEEKLNSDIQKLQDPAYIARYAREKYLYSKDGEIIIRIDEDE